MSTTSNTVVERLYLMRVATAPAMNNTPFVCYLVQTSDGKNIVIDSGLPAALPPASGGFAPVLDKNVHEQLALLDIRPEDIHILICTHFDGDHCGHNEEFPNAELIVQRAQYEAAHEGHPRFVNTRSHWDLPAERYRLVDGDTTLLPGFELIDTHGHTPGHQSVLLHLPQTGPVLLTIDAAANAESFKADRQKGPMDVNGEEAIASTRKMLALAEREHVTLAIFGHDGPQWSTLKLLPDYYA